MSTSQQIRKIEGIVVATITHEPISTKGKVEENVVGVVRTKSLEENVTIGIDLQWSEPIFEEIIEETMASVVHTESLEENVVVGIDLQWPEPIVEQMEEDNQKIE